MAKHIERFAPSPTGLLHLGHAFSALTAFEAAQKANGDFLIRLEDIDEARCRTEYIQAIFDDLEWLGISWKQSILRQSERKNDYAKAVQQLTDMGLTYACSCTRRDIMDALSAPQENHLGPDGVIYPGTCKHQGLEYSGNTIRLDMTKAMNKIGNVDITFKDCEVGEIIRTASEMIKNIGDIVLARKDIGTSYHIAVVVDDAYQNITHVTRGNDLLDATPIHRLLQILLGFHEPHYHHHRLIRDDNGKRLAKRDDARAIRKYREEGASPTDIRKMLNL